MAALVFAHMQVTKHFGAPYNQMTQFCNMENQLQQLGICTAG